MKQYSFCLAFLALPFFFPLLTAANPATTALSIEKLDNAFKMVRVSISGHQYPVVIAVYDYRQQVIMELESPPSQPFSKILDLSKLPSGSFFLSIQTENREILQPLRITPADLIMNEHRRMHFFTPTYRLQQRQLDINWLNTQVSQLDLAIVDWSGSPIFYQQIRNVVSVQKSYDLSQLPKGKYQLTLKTPRKTWNHTIEIH
jgi:hypothetical protein